MIYERESHFAQEEILLAARRMIIIARFALYWVTRFFNCELFIDTPSIFQRASNIFFFFLHLHPEFFLVLVISFRFGGLFFAQSMGGYQLRVVRLKFHQN